MSNNTMVHSQIQLFHVMYYEYMLLKNDTLFHNNSTPLVFVTPVESLGMVSTCFYYQYIDVSNRLTHISEQYTGGLLLRT